MNRLTTTMMMLLLMVSGLIGCREAEITGPPTVKLGHDVCAHCGMLINDERFAAAAIVHVDGRNKAVLFDDIGDLADYMIENTSSLIQGRWVKDYTSRDWINAESAHYVHVPDLQTPMGSGMVAFSSAEAGRFPQGKRLGFAELIEFRTAGKKNHHE